MSGGTELAVDHPPLMRPPPGEFHHGLDIESLDTPFMSRGSDGVILDDLDFDFSFDDLCMPSSDVLEDLLKPSSQETDRNRGPEPDFPHFVPNFDQFDGVIKSTSPELRHPRFSGDQSWDSSGVLSSASPGMESRQISGYLNMPSPESNSESTGNCDADLNCPSPESRGSGNFESNVSEDSNNCTGRSVSSSPNSSAVDQKIKLEESANNNGQKSLLKRKKEGEDSLKSSPDTKNVKYRKSNCSLENDNTSMDMCGMNEEEEKRKIRLMRNRESAQLSRQRKKHYIEELEDKVRTMHSTIQDLNMKISYVMAENATLRQQVGGPSGGSSTAAAAAPPSPMVPPPVPGMYPPHPAMMYPWMPCPPPYMMKSQGSQVPLVPIPRLKPQQPVQAPKENKKVKNRKNEGAETKKVAGVSFLGLLFFIMLFGGLVPMVNVRFGGVGETFTSGETHEKHHGRVLMVNGSETSEKHGGRRDFSNSSIYCDDKGCGSSRGEPSADEFVRMGNESEHLAASLYVPRNDKLVKIDGNLIIHSVLASEKATMASHEKGDGETSLAFRGDLVPAVPVPDTGRNGGRHQHLRALGSGPADKDSVKPPATDGRLQQWFREGLAGPMMSSGMCTEVFQFDVSAASTSGAIVPASATRNLSEEEDRNCTQPNKGRNRRILHSIPLPGSGHNISTDHTGSSKKDNMSGNKNASSMVVSVLFDPREAGDADVEGVIGTKSLSRIFVVVLIDNVRYVTYSCMLPFKAIANHLVE